MTVCNEWHVSIQDDAGRRLPGVSLERHWSAYHNPLISTSAPNTPLWKKEFFNLKIGMNEGYVYEKEVSDAAGVVRFPKRSITRWGLVGLIFRKASCDEGRIIHPSCKPGSYYHDPQSKDYKYSRLDADTSGVRRIDGCYFYEMVLEKCDIGDAVRAVDLGWIEALLEKNPVLVSSRGSRGGTPLHEALTHASALDPLAVHGNERIIQFLIEKGAPLEAKDSDGMTPLHEAAFRGREIAMRMLLSRSVSTTIPDNWGRTPLHMAIQGAQVGAARLLIDLGVPVDVKDGNGHTPADAARRLGNLEMIRLFDP